MEEEVIEEEMQQVAAVAQDGQTFYVQLPKSVQIGPNNIVTTETNEDGQQILRIIEMNQEEEPATLNIENVPDDSTIAEELPSMPEEMEVEAENLPVATEEKVPEVNADEIVQEPASESAHNLELFQQAMALLQKKNSDTATAIVTGPDSSETVFIVHGNGEEISLEAAEAALQQQPGDARVIVLAPPVEPPPVEQPNADTSASTASTEAAPENPVSEDVQKVVSGIENPQETDPVTIVKRSRGRPRKIKPPPNENVIVVEKPKVAAKAEEEPVITSSGRPRRKAAQRFLETWKSYNEDPDVEESGSPPASPSRLKKPPKLPLFKENKENVAPIKRKPDLTSVNITLHDKAALQVMDDIGIHMMYYCRRCTFFSRRLNVVTEHIYECRQKELSEDEKRRAQEASLTNAILNSAALKGIAAADISAIKSAGTDSIAIDEHNYAEVDVDENLPGDEVQDQPPEAVLIEIPELQEELRPRKWFCLDCPEVIISEKDLEIHRRCHGKEGLDPLHCYVCAEEKGRVPEMKYEWKDIRTHLRHYHDVDFEISCLYCSEPCEDHAAFNTHVETHGLGCPKEDCDFKADSIEVITIHENSHMEGSDGFRCFMCSQMRPNWPLLRDHVVKAHPGYINLLYCCTECEEPFQEQVSFQQHMVGNTSAGKLACHLCSEEFYLCVMPSHLRTMHLDADGEEAARVIEKAASHCPLLEIENPVELTQNASEVLPESEDQLKEIVTVAVAPVVEDQDEQDKVLQEPAPVESVKSQIGAKKYRCPQHELVFYSQADLTKHHMEVHWGVTKEKVAHAEEEKIKQQELKATSESFVPRGRGRPRKNSRNDDAKDPEFKIPGFSVNRKITPSGQSGTAKCKLCYKNFSSTDTLAKHTIRSHAPEKMGPVDCQFCGKTFRNSIQLRNHVRVVHEGIKRINTNKKKYITKKKTFMCETCGYTTPELNRLTNHKLSVHDGHYPFQCTICDYKTNERADMRRHENKHQGVKRYSCAYCSYKSDQRWLLVNHCSRQHGIHLNRLKRNTKGTHWSNRKKRKEEAEAALAGAAAVPGETLVIEQHNNGPFTQEIVIGGGVHHLGDGYFVPLVTTNEHGEETVSMVALGNGGADNIPPSHEISVETVEEEARGGEVVYIQEDGTIVNPDDAIMLVAVAPGGDQAPVQMEETY